jgi:DnaJ-class molecular chaperone
MVDPYHVLGVKRDAAQADIRKAYLRLAKKNHPDLHPGDKGAEARFKDISSANDIVGDEKKRAAFDAGEIDAAGAAAARKPEREFYRPHAEAPPGYKYQRASADGDRDDSDLFAELFGRTGGRSQRRGADIHYTLSVDFTEAVNGTKKRVVMADGKTLDITIPAGLQDGQTLRLRGQGQPGINNGEVGDTLVAIHVRPHAMFRRDGNDIRAILPVTLAEALTGAKVPVATASGPVQLAIPKRSNTGTVLRLRGKGVQAKTATGDHFVELQVILPEAADDELIKLIADWEAKHPYNPRQQPQEAKS